MVTAKKRAIIRNQVFIGCSWKGERPRYARLVDKFARRFPLSFVIVGRETEHTAEELLALIQRKLLSSSRAIFDVTGGNANVSLEFGITLTTKIVSALYLNVDRRRRQIGGETAIIADLAGQKRKQYQSESSLEKLLIEFCKSHVYTQLFEKSLFRVIRKMTRGQKNSFRTLALRVIHALDGNDTIRRDDLIQELRAEEWKASEIEKVLKVFHKDQLLYITPGRFSTVQIS